MLGLLVALNWREREREGGGGRKGWLHNGGREGEEGERERERERKLERERVRDSEGGERNGEERGDTTEEG